MFERDDKNSKISVIQYEGKNDTFVWKHPIQDFTMGSQLIVHESQEALFVKNGEALDLFPSGHYLLETQNIPMTSRLFKAPVENGDIFQAEVYFVNQTVQMGIKWGTDSRVRMFDPMSGLYIEIGACGEFNLRVSDSRKLVVKLVGAEQELSRTQLLSTGEQSGNQTGMQGYFRAMIMTYVKSFLAQSIKERAVSILEIDGYLEELSFDLKEKINRALAEYGLKMPEFYITRIMTPDDDPNFRRLKQQYADKYLKIREEEILRSEAEAKAERKAVEAAAEARVNIIRTQGEAETIKIKGEAEAAAYRMQAEAEAQEMRMKGYTYAEETARKIGLGAVENGFGMGQSGGMGGDGESGGGSIGTGAGMMGDLMNLGIGLNVMSGVMGMTKDAMQPVFDNTKQMGNAMSGLMNPQDANLQNVNTVSGGWNCSCGAVGQTGKFCSNCGKKKEDGTNDGKEE